MAHTSLLQSDQRRPHLLLSVCRHGVRDNCAVQQLGELDEIHAAKTFKGRQRWQTLKKKGHNCGSVVIERVNRENGIQQ